ncbi:MAG: hypothetical protein M0R80_28725 [Proteobacteria bacterium]|jgi:hypothetical protein|nr:hypothetical protein [Pseudomonadota bacterium]
MKTTLDDLIARSSVEQASPLTVEAEVLQEAAAELKADRRKRAVTACKGLIDSFTNILQASVKHLRQVREQEALEAKSVKAIGLALQYFGTTGNPLPFYKASGRTRDAAYWCENCGIPFPKDDDAAWLVPADWQPTESK